MLGLSLAPSTGRLIAELVLQPTYSHRSQTLFADPILMISVDRIENLCSTLFQGDVFPGKTTRVSKLLVKRFRRNVAY